MDLAMFFRYLINTNTYSKKAPGIMLRFRFPNNYGASVVKHKGSYGYPESYEIGILYNDELYYHSSIANDVIGYVNPKDIGGILLQIKGLDDHLEGENDG